MLDTLRLVRGAVATKDLVPLMTHFMFKDGRVQATNGRITIDAALEASELNNCAVPAEKFFKAVEICEGEPTIRRDNFFVYITRKKFKAKLPCLDHEVKLLQRPDNTKSDGKLPIEPFRKLLPFVSKDASRPWSIGILLKDGYGYATNNVIVTRAPIEYTGQQINLPSYCVEEILALRDLTCDVQFANNGLYLMPEGTTTWIHTRSLDLNWPDIERFFTDGEIPEFDGAAVLRDIVKVRGFVPDDEHPVIVLDGGVVTTLDGNSSATIEGHNFPGKSLWMYDPLRMVLEQATRLDLAQYPKPCPWSGNGLEGAVVGTRA